MGTVISGCGERAQSGDQGTAMSHDMAGVAASIAASFEVDAARACKVAGIDDIGACAQQNGTLLPEKEAKALAKVALAQHKGYNERCRKTFDIAYCDDLLGRAIKMEWRKPIDASASLGLEPK
jgi:hypothetical protein